MEKTPIGFTKVAHWERARKGGFGVGAFHVRALGEKKRMGKNLLRGKRRTGRR